MDHSQRHKFERQKARAKAKTKAVDDANAALFGGLPEVNPWEEFFGPPVLSQVGNKQAREGHDKKREKEDAWWKDFCRKHPPMDNFEQAMSDWRNGKLPPGIAEKIRSTFEDGTVSLFTKIFSNSDAGDESWCAPEETTTGPCTQEEPRHRDP